MKSKMYSQYSFNWATMEALLIKPILPLVFKICQQFLPSSSSVSRVLSGVVVSDSS